MNPPGPGVFLDPDAARLLREHARPRRALFLDRDGVINVDRAYVHRRQDTDWVDGIFDLCGIARDAGYLLIVVTNQAGVARGLYSEEDLLDYTRWMHGEFAQRDVRLLATWYCPHHPDFGVDCRCRKPRPGMLHDAAHEYHVDLPGSLLVGDKDGDMQAAHAAGIPHAFKVDDSQLVDAIAWMHHSTRQQPGGA